MNSVDSILVIEPLKPLDHLPREMVNTSMGIENELLALGVGPKYPMNGPEDHSFREGLEQNERLLWTNRKEIAELLTRLTGREVEEEEIFKLVTASIVTDLGKVGSNPIRAGEVPQNLVARVYREFRWTQAQADRAGQGRTTVPFGRAVEVMRELAWERYPNDRDEIERIFSFDEAELGEYGFDANTPLAQVFTGLHLRANAKLLPQLGIAIPERDYASGHHFPAGLKLLPRESVVEVYDLNGVKGDTESFLGYVANAAILTVTDRLQGLVQRSYKTPMEACDLLRQSISKELEANFGDHPNHDRIVGIFGEVMGFVIKNRFAEYYVDKQN